MDRTIKRIFWMIFWLYAIRTAIKYICLTLVVVGWILYKAACLMRYAFRKFIRKAGVQRFIPPKNLVGRRGTPIARKLREVGLYQ